MTGAQHRRRPLPERTGPIRAAKPGARPESPAASAPPPNIPPGASSPAQDAVATAYAVAGQNFAEGRMAAERLRAAAPPLSTPPDVSAAAQRLMLLSKDMSAAWADLLAVVLRDSELRTALGRIFGGERPAPGPSGGSGPPAWLVQRISSRRPVEVTVSATGEAPPVLPPLVAGLHSPTPHLPPIDQVVFRGRPGGGLEVQIDVPDDQPAGTYAGAFVDAESGRPLGALAVRVFE